MKTLGIILVVVGIVMTVFTGFNLITKKKVVDVGPLQVDKKESTPVYWSPITGAVIGVVGVVILVAGRKK